MSKKNVWLMVLFSLLILCVSCGQVANEDDISDGYRQTPFQDNGGREYPDFYLTEIFDGKGGLEEMWDSIDADGYNERFNKVVDDYVDDFVIFSLVASSILSEPYKVVIPLAANDGGALLDYLIDPEANYPIRDEENTEAHYYVGDGETYMDGFYSFLDEVFKDGEDPGNVDMVRSNYKVMSRILDKRTPAEIHKDMEDIMEDIRDPDFKDDFIDLTTALGKMMLRSDYPQKGIGLGNPVKGMVNLFMWYNRMEKNPETRLLMREHVNELVSLFDPSPDSKNSEKVKTLLKNIKSHFTVDGDVYSGKTVDTDWASKYGYSNIYGPIDDDEIYSDTELGNTIREFIPGSLQLLMRSDRPNALIATKEGEEPVYILRKMIENLKNLDYDPETANIEQSILNLMRYDLRGRDRLTDPEAYGISHLENLVYLTHVTCNLGWEDGGTTGEINNDTSVNYDHGHGEFTGRLTLNDSLFSIRTFKTLGTLGLFEVSFGDDDGKDVHRSMKPFTREQRDNYRFYYNQNYDVLQFMAPPCVGDLGSPEGGNPDGTLFNSNDVNKYRAYSNTGLNENQLAAWTLGAIVRACFNGEGPYYYADPSADHFRENGKTWYAYKRPNGKIYAYVNKDNPETWEYFYPADDDSETDNAGTGTINGKRQRYNRYKSQWNTDYYMIHCNAGDADHYWTLDNSGDELSRVEVTDGPGDAGALTYNEIIAETEAKRACLTPEEALFRNFQWFMTEKKMVIVIPMQLDVSPDDNPDSSQVAVFQVIEANGLDGLCQSRKFADNKVWAKKGTTGKSSIPGDYRIGVISSEDGIPFGGDSIYNNTIDCGHATPSILVMNSFVLSRFGFPRYISKTNHGGTSLVYDQELGSKEFEVGDETWNERSGLLSPFIALIGALREYTPPFDQYHKEENRLRQGLKTFGEATSPLMKPLIYYQKTTGTYPHETWKARMNGSETPGASPKWNDYVGDGFLRSAADFHNELNNKGGATYKASAWDGSELEKRFYLPAEEQTLLGMLIDSDVKAQPSENTRMNGVLPVLMENKAITKMLEALLSETNDTDLFYSGIEQVQSFPKFSKGRLTEINETNGKNLVFPSWLFVVGDGAGAYGEDVNFAPLNPEDTLRDSDIILDRGIDRLIGHTYINEELDGYGLVQYVDEQEEKGWVDFDDNLDFIEDLLHPSSDYSVVESSHDINEKVFGRDRLYTEKEVSGLIYAVGKLLTHYDVQAETETWINQGEEGFDDLWTIVHDHLPAIHNLMRKDPAACEAACSGAADYKTCLLETDACFTGDNYRSALMVNRDMLKTDGVVEYLVSTMETKVGWEDVLADAADFLKTDLVTKDKPLWWSLSELLEDLATAVDKAKDGTILDSVYKEYGFQKN